MKLKIDANNLIAMRIVLALIVTSLVSCGGNTLELKQVYASQYCAVSNAAIVEIHDQSDLSKVVRAGFALEDDEQAYPQGDYDSARLFLISLGTKPNSSYALSLIESRASIESGQLELPVELSEPDASKQYAQVLVNPCMVVAVPKGNYTSISAAGMHLTIEK